MNYVIAAVAVVVLVLAVLVARRLSLRGRAASQRREVDRLTPPESPYAPPQRLRLVDEAPGETPVIRPAPARPRLESHDYVFGEAGSPSEEPARPARHDADWALQRTTRRRRRRWRSRQWMRLGVVVLILALAGGYVLQRGAPATTTSTTTTSTWPSSFDAKVTGHSAATVVVPESKYSVSLTATKTTSVKLLGPSGTYFNGTLSAGESKTFSVSGFATVYFPTLDVRVALDNSPVTLPSVALAPYWLTLSPG